LHSRACEKYAWEISGTCTAYLLYRSFVSIEVSGVLCAIISCRPRRAEPGHGARPAERRPSPTAVTIYPTSIVDGKLENCASKVAQIRLSRRAELVSPVRQPALLHSRACLTGSC